VNIKGNVPRENCVNKQTKKRRKTTHKTLDKFYKKIRRKWEGENTRDKMNLKHKNNNIINPLNDQPLGDHFCW